MTSVAEIASVDPDFGFPVGPLEEQQDALAAPGLGDDDVLLVPGGAFVLIRTVQPAGFRWVDFRALAGFVGTAGEEEEVGGEGVFEPALGASMALGIELEAPGAGEGNAF